jgi:hypothetical protein
MNYCKYKFKIKGKGGELNDGKDIRGLKKVYKRKGNIHLEACALTAQAW